ncbi:MAG: RRQRL motif-containing zinc-binding protein [Pseudonocardiaceae bacterium]
MPAPAAVAFWDPAGERYGIPTYPWRQAPAHYATLRQLTAQRLRPGGQGVQAQILWRTRGGAVRVAYLYDTRRARPKRTPTAAQRAALAKALAARRTCPRCRTDRGYVLPVRIGACKECATEWEIDAA